MNTRLWKRTLTVFFCVILFYTNEYYTLEGQQTSPLNWQTRIGKFRFPHCQNALPRKIYGTIRNASTGQPIANARIFSGRERNFFVTSANGTYQIYVPGAGSHSLQATADVFFSVRETIYVS